MFYQIYKEILIRQRRFLQIISIYLWRSRVASGLHQGSKKRGPKGEGRAVIYKPFEFQEQQVYGKLMVKPLIFSENARKHSLFIILARY